MDLKPIDFSKFEVKAIDIWENQWFLLTAGDFQSGEFNTMTVGWGSFGLMWKKPFAQVVVRPVRYTYEFTEKYDSFTLCAFSNIYKITLNMLGTKSGRDGDKIKEAQLTPIASTLIAAPGFSEAELIIECRKIYWQDFDPANFLDKSINKNYPLKDYHRVYFGEIVEILR